MRPSAVLLDLDGTVYQGNVLIPGAYETLSFLKNASIPFRFITNTTRLTKRKLVFMLGDMGLSVSLDDIFAAPHAAAIYCKKRYWGKAND